MAHLGQTSFTIVTLEEGLTTMGLEGAKSRSGLQYIDGHAAVGARVCPLEIQGFARIVRGVHLSQGELIVTAAHQHTSQGGGQTVEGFGFDFDFDFDLGKKPSTSEKLLDSQGPIKSMLRLGNTPGFQASMYYAFPWVLPDEHKETDCTTPCFISRSRRGSTKSMIWVL